MCGLISGNERGTCVCVCVCKAKRFRTKCVSDITFSLARLLNRQRDEWGDTVTIVSSDMRLWTPLEKVNTPNGFTQCSLCVCVCVRACVRACVTCVLYDVQADILVSELLGSFGDNELSPECLDGAQSFLKSKNIIQKQRLHWVNS